jgi:tRNA-2-methylthio-N6-dimethylallyladenosine synthase
MDRQVADNVKSDRLQRLQRTIERNRGAFNARCLGADLDVLFEKPGRHPGQLVGRSPYLQPVQVMATSNLIGEIRAVSIAEVGPNSLFGSLAAHGTVAPELPIALQAGE